MPSNPRSFTNRGKLENPNHSKNLREISSIDASLKVMRAQEKTITDKSSEAARAKAEAAAENSELKKVRIAKQEIEAAIEKLPDVRAELAIETAKLSKVKAETKALEFKKPQLQDETKQIEQENSRVKLKRTTLQTEIALLQYSLNGDLTDEQKQLVEGLELPEVIGKLVEAEKSKADAKIKEIKANLTISERQLEQESLARIKKFRETEDAIKESIKSNEKLEKEAKAKADLATSDAAKKQSELDDIDEILKKKYALKEKELASRESDISEIKEDLLFVVAVANNTIDALNQVKPQLEIVHGKRLKHITIPKKIILNKKLEDAA